MLIPERVDIIKEETLKLISLYKKEGLTVPFSLKGNIGEFIVYKKLVEQFPDKEIKFAGGARPSYDVELDDKKIQVKTKVVEKDKYSLLEGCPTIKRKIIDEKMCDIIVLVILYFNEEMSKVEKTNIYVFNQKDFPMFSHVGCWSGNSRGDYTIRNIIEVYPGASQKYMAKINFYNNPTYKNLFNSSKDNWDKIFD